MCIIFLIIFSLPPLLNWFIFDANISGDTKEACTGGGACWVYIKVWFNRFMYGMYPNAEQWRINIHFCCISSLWQLDFLYLLNLEIIFLFITPLYYQLFLYLNYYLISGGSFGLEWVETGAWGGLSLTL